MGVMFFSLSSTSSIHITLVRQEGQHPLTGQRATISGYWPTSEPDAG